MKFVLMFVAVVAGMVLGKILKIGSLGTLFTGLEMGWAVQNRASETVAISNVAAHTKASERLLKISVVEKTFFLYF